MYNLELFDRVAEHLLKQNAKSISNTDGNKCLYRGPNGLKCAVGFLITDEAYSGDIEDKHSDTPEVRAALIKSGIKLDLDTIGMLSGLQNIHDSASVEDWPKELTMARQRYAEDNRVYGGNNYTT